MGKRQTTEVGDFVADQQNVDVDRPGGVAGPAGFATELALDRLAGGQQLEWLERCLDPQSGITEVSLVGDLPDRLGLVDGRASDDRDPLRAIDQGACRPDVFQPIPNVGAKPQVGDRQRVTSTDTSSTRNGIGGSGLVARTTSPLAPKRSSSMSATELQTLSSVRYDRSVATSSTASQTAA